MLNLWYQEYSFGWDLSKPVVIQNEDFVGLRVALDIYGIKTLLRISIPIESERQLGCEILGGTWNRQALEWEVDL